MPSSMTPGCAAVESSSQIFHAMFLSSALSERKTAKSVYGSTTCLDHWAAAAPSGTVSENQARLLVSAWRSSRRYSAKQRAKEDKPFGWRNGGLRPGAAELQHV